MSDKPLFIPLKAEYFDAFELGHKRTEYRVHSKRWSEKHCYAGRPVTLSRGYGKQNRLSGVITGFEVKKRHELQGLVRASLAAIYPDGGDEAACIHIALD